MTDHLARLALRATGAATPGLRPRSPSMFEQPIATPTTTGTRGQPASDVPRPGPAATAPAAPPEARRAAAPPVSESGHMGYLVRDLETRPDGQRGEAARTEAGARPDGDVEPALASPVRADRRGVLPSDVGVAERVSAALRSVTRQPAERGNLQFSPLEPALPTAPPVSEGRQSEDRPVEVLVRVDEQIRAAVEAEGSGDRTPVVAPTPMPTLHPQPLARRPGSPPQVTVSIGRIEVLPAPAAPAKPPPRSRPQPKSSGAPKLADYLRDRSRR